MNKEQEWEVFEWCGWTFQEKNVRDYARSHPRYTYYKSVAGWYDPKGKHFIARPYLDIKNLFRYPIPKLWIELGKEGQSYKLDRLWDAIKQALSDDTNVAEALGVAVLGIIKEVWG